MGIVFQADALGALAVKSLAVGGAFSLITFFPFAIFLPLLQLYIFESFGLRLSPPTSLTDHPPLSRPCRQESRDHDRGHVARDRRRQCVSKTSLYATPPPPISNFLLPQSHFPLPTSITLPFSIAMYHCPVTVHGVCVISTAYGILNTCGAFLHLTMFCSYVVCSYSRSPWRVTFFCV